MTIQIIGLLSHDSPLSMDKENVVDFSKFSVNLEFEK